MSKLAFLLFFFMMPSLVLISDASAHPEYFKSECAGCHYDVAATCNGCHAHGVHSGSAGNDLNLSGTTDKTVYVVGEKVKVTVTGGYRKGWVRAVLYDQDMNEVARSAGPENMGGGNGFPVVLSAPAPDKPGTYQWNVGWYGSRFDAGGAFFGSRWKADLGNEYHGQEIINTNSFIVVDSAAPVMKTTPEFLDFGSVMVGSSAVRTITVQNRGSAELDIESIDRCSGTGDEFEWSPSSSFTVSPGHTVNLKVTFRPLEALSHSGCLKIYSNDPVNQEIYLNLSASAIPPPPQGVHMHILGFSASKRVSVVGDVVSFNLYLISDGTIGGSAGVTLVGKDENNAEIYRKEISVAAQPGAVRGVVFPAYKPGSIGAISWTVEVEGSPAEKATADTQVELAHLPVQ